MEQGTASQPNPASLDRLTGKAIFFPAGSAGGTDLGVIELHRLEYGPEREKYRVPITRSVVLETEETISVSPVFAIEGRQFHTMVLPLLLLGTRSADATQTAATGATLTITAQLGRTFDLGARNVTNVVVVKLVGGATQTEGQAYFLEANKGLIRFPNWPYGIEDGASVIVTFDRPALTRESYAVFDQLNQTGTLKLFEMDSRLRSPKAEWTVPGTLTAESGGDGDPLKFRKWKVRFSPSAAPQVLRRLDFVPLLYDDSTEVILG